MKNDFENVLTSTVFYDFKKKVQGAHLFKLVLQVSQSVFLSGTICSVCVRRSLAALGLVQTFF